MATIQAMVRYADGSTHEVWDDYRAVEFIPDADKIRKITFYNEAKKHVHENFLLGQHIRFQDRRDYITYVGDTAQFIVYNW